MDQTYQLTLRLVSFSIYKLSIYPLGFELLKRDLEVVQVLSFKGIHEQAR